MSSTRLTGLLALLFCVPAAFATTYITVPTDRELITQSRAIVIATVEGSYVQRAEGGGGFETIYEIRVQRSIKGNVTREVLLRVASPGGEMGRFGSYTPGAAHFTNGEKTLLFLSREGGRWTVTHMALGSWRFGKSLRGHGLLVRDLAEVETFDRGDRREPLRSEQKFLRFIEEVVAGEPAEENYLVHEDEASATASTRILRPQGNSLSDPKRYTQMGVGSLGVRWPTSMIASNLTFYKQATSHLSGAGDNGVSVIQTALAAWTNDTPSAVTLTYAGTHTNLPLATTGGNPDYEGFADGLNIIQYNAAIGSAGVANIVFYTNDTDGSAGTGYREIIDADIRISSSLNSGSLGLPSIMTHELGHAIGFRHSNASPASPNDSATTCALPDDCVSNTNGAIMLWQVTNAGNGYVLQPWDIRAVGAVYPGAGLPVAPTNVSAAATSTTTVNITWTLSTAPQYRVYRRTAGGSYSLRGTTAGNSFDDSATASTAYQYMVRGFDGVSTESADSNADLATTHTYTDTSLTGVAVKAVHFTQSQAAINAVRALAGLTTTSFAPITAGSTTVQAAHINTMRTALAEARSQLLLAPATFTDTVNPGTPIKAAHVQDFRNWVQ